MGVLGALVFALAVGLEVERVLALVNGVPVLSSDVDLAVAAGLIPRGEGEDDKAYRNGVAEALVLLELRWQDLETAGLTSQLHPDLAAASRKVVTDAGGEAELERRLAALGLPRELLSELVRRAALVEAYVAKRFAPFARATDEEVARVWQSELVPQLEARGEAVPLLHTVRATVESIVHERKLAAEVAEWTADLEERGEVVRYF